MTGYDCRSLCGPLVHMRRLTPIPGSEVARYSAVQAWVKLAAQYCCGHLLSSVVFLLGLYSLTSLILPGGLTLILLDFMNPSRLGTVCIWLPHLP